MNIWIEDPTKSCLTIRVYNKFLFFSLKFLKILPSAINHYFFSYENIFFFVSCQNWFLKI